MGIGTYVTTTEPVNGVLKGSPEDFVVEEIPIPMEKLENGKYTIIKVKLREWDTNRFLIFLARQLHISNKRITYAGTKDKNAVTTQYFCINHDFQPERLNINDCEVLDAFRTNRILGLGDLMGNRFRINLRASTESIHAITEAVRQLREIGGFPNYFGLQRFGSVRTNTHVVGKLIVQGKEEEAASRYIFDPDIDREEYRMDFGKTRDANAALRDFPGHLNFERSLLGYLQEHGTLKGAFSVFPKNLKIMFVHAYQSYLFNMILTERIREIGLNNVSDGDIVLPVDYLFNATTTREIRVNSMNRTMIAESIARNELRPSIPLIGYESSFSGGVQGQIEKELVEKEGIGTEMFRIPEYRDMWSSGERRIVSCMPSDFRINEDVSLDFSLGRGIYATSLLREFLKEKMNW